MAEKRTVDDSQFSEERTLFAVPICFAARPMCVEPKYRWLIQQRDYGPQAILALSVKHGYVFLGGKALHRTSVEVTMGLYRPHCLEMATGPASSLAKVGAGFHEIAHPEVVPEVKDQSFRYARPHESHTSVSRLLGEQIWSRSFPRSYTIA